MQNNSFHSNPQKNKERTPNMCKAIIEIQNESKQLGIEQGISQGQKLALNILTYIMHNPNESSEDIAKRFKCETSYIDRFRSAIHKAHFHLK